MEWLTKEKLQKKTFYGKEKKIACVHHRHHEHDFARHRSAEHRAHEHAFRESGRYQENDRFNIVLANPPFGGRERSEVQQNFPIKTGETAFLFLQHFIKILLAGGRGGIVIKNTFLSNTDNASVSLRKHLLETCNLHTVLQSARRNISLAQV